LIKSVERSDALTLGTSHSSVFGCKSFSPWNAGIYDRAIQSLLLRARMLYLNGLGNVKCPQY
jgi:hypothetical protein